MRIKTEGKRILTFLFTVILMLCMSLNFVGCFYEYTPQYEPDLIYGDFTYCYVTSATSNNKVSKDEAIGVNILELVGEAREKDTIIIPETIDGLPVIAIGMNGLGWSIFLKGEYEKLYLPNSLLHIQDLSRTISHRKNFLLDSRQNFNLENRKILLSRSLKVDVNFFVFETFYQQYQDLEGIDRLDRIHIANLIYIVDGIEYWMDDCKDGQYVQIPPNPNKEGFIFDGWYLEDEYINKWDFSTNTYKKPQGSVSLKLYAKFVIEE